MKPLVGDEIQRHEIKIGRGRDRVAGSGRLVACLMDLCLGASFHAVIIDYPPRSLSEFDQLMFQVQ
jgi:hypothetical protein